MGRRTRVSGRRARSGSGIGRPRRSQDDESRLTFRQSDAHGAQRGKCVARHSYAPAMTREERAAIERAIQRVTEQAANADAIVDEAMAAGLDRVGSP
jgi:hypothetical protein